MDRLNAFIAIRLEVSRGTASLPLIPFCSTILLSSPVGSLLNINSTTLERIGGGVLRRNDHEPGFSEETPQVTFEKRTERSTKRLSGTFVDDSGRSNTPLLADDLSSVLTSDLYPAPKCWPYFICKHLLTGRC
ncbi:hypothetical protein RRG08_041890 [Elysia crispata]|uniref:Uncharacterized protein n=1 Tax=Elysia crispata TaxID=231223 RepID=A0AAE0Y1I9_9GAST|nr:hypothetical protein RRG08_041890 [Elysia crispata]